MDISRIVKVTTYIHTRDLEIPKAAAVITATSDLSLGAVRHDHDLPSFFSTMNFVCDGQEFVFYPNNTFFPSLYSSCPPLPSPRLTQRPELFPIILAPAESNIQSWALHIDSGWRIQVEQVPQQCEPRSHCSQWTSGFRDGSLQRSTNLHWIPQQLGGVQANHHLQQLRTDSCNVTQSSGVLDQRRRKKPVQTLECSSREEE